MKSTINSKTLTKIIQTKIKVCIPKVTICAQNEKDNLLKESLSSGIKKTANLRRTESWTSSRSHCTPSREPSTNQLQRVPETILVIIVPVKVWNLGLHNMAYH
jgi:hypothetical protein